MMKRRMWIIGCLLLMLLLAVIWGGLMFADTPEPAYWAKTYGWSEYERPNSICGLIQCADGGYIQTGITYHFGPNTLGACMMKLDPAGNTSWQKVFNTTSHIDYFDSISRTADGGYIAGGSSYTSGSNRVSWIVKFDAADNISWGKVYNANSFGTKVSQTADGGYIMGAIQYNVWRDENWLVMKLDAAGNIVWQKLFNAGDVDELSTIVQASDGGYFATGACNYGYGASTGDVWAMKLNGSGDIIWQKKYGGSALDYGMCGLQTADGNYLMAGFTQSYGAGSNDCWIVKLDTQGNILWQKTYGGISDDAAYQITRTADGGYALTGHTNSYGAGDYDRLVIKLDGSGNILWQKAYGGSSYDDGFQILQTFDGGYVMTGETNCYGAGDMDLWTLKLDASGNCPPLGIDTNCMVANSNCTPMDSYVTPVNTSYTSADFVYTVTDTNCIVNQQAMGPTPSPSPTPTSTLIVTASWHCATASASWPVRNNHASLCFDNKMWVIAGLDGSSERGDVWFSADGTTWTQANSNAFSTRRNMAAGIVFNDKMWIIGGHNFYTGPSVPLNEVWYSSNGASWTQAPNAPWVPRFCTGNVVAFHDKIFVLGGGAYGGNKNDVWYTSDGINWSQGPNAAWSPRASCSSIVYDNKIWVMGGNDGPSEKNDVWYSLDGISWTQATSNAPWSPRHQFSSVVYNNEIWIMSGYNGTTGTNDVWHTSDGINWTRAADAPWSPRWGAGGVVYDNKIWINGGYDGSSFRNDVWYYSEETVPSSPTPEITATPSPNPTATPSPTPTVSPSPTNTPEPTPMPSPTVSPVSNRSNFNGTAIATGNTIWFNSIIKVNGRGNGPARLHFTGSTIQFTANGINYNLPVPDSAVIFAAGVTSAATVFNPATN